MKARLLFIPLLVVLMSFSVSAYWNTSFQQRTCFNLTNTDSLNLSINTTMNVSFDTASLISSGRMKSDCADLRVTFNDTYLIPFTINPVGFEGADCNNAKTNVVFRLQQELASGTRGDYCFYYNNSGAANAKTSNSTAYQVYEYNYATRSSCGDTYSSFAPFEFRYGVNTTLITMKGTAYDLAVCSLGTIAGYFDIKTDDESGWIAYDVCRQTSLPTGFTAEAFPRVLIRPFFTGEHKYVFNGMSETLSTFNASIDGGSIETYPLVSFRTQNQEMSLMSAFGNPTLCSSSKSNISAYWSPRSGFPTTASSYSTFALSFPAPNVAPLMAFSLPVSPVLLDFGSNVTNVTIAFKSVDDYNATNNCSLSSNFGLSYSNASVLNNTLTLVLATNVSAGNYVIAGNCSDTASLFGNASLSFEVKPRLFINQTIIQPLVCPSDSVPNSILFVFIGLSLFMMIGLNEIFIRIPIINSIIGVGAVMYGFTLIGCSAVIGVVFIIFGLFAMIASFVRSF